MTLPLRVTRRQARVLAYLLESRHFRYPVNFVDAHRATRAGPATYYPLMVRLETYGWVKSTQEVLPEGAVVPPRTFYALTERGAEWAQHAVDERKRRRAFWRRWTMGKRKKR